jgi:hypothetical protein
MRTLAWVIVGAGALTLLLSPTARRTTLQAIFNSDHGVHLPRWVDEYADRPLPPPYTGPKYRTWKNGVPQ